TAQAYHFVGRAQHRLGNAKEGEQALRRQIALLRDLVAEFPAKALYRFDLFHSLRELAIALVGVDRTEEREALHHEADDLIEQLVREFPGEPDYKDALANQSLQRGAIVFGQGKYEEAERLYRVALALAEELTRRFPNKRTPPHYPANIVNSLNALAILAYVTG